MNEIRKIKSLVSGKSEYFKNEFSSFVVQVKNMDQLKAC